MIRFLLSSALLIQCGLAAAAEPFYAYSPYESPDNGIRVGLPKDTALQVYPKISDPAISPDGKKVVGTVFEEAGRRLVVIDLATGDSTRLPVEGREVYGGLWSPDGSKIAFHILREHWGVGLINADGTEFNILTKTTKPEDDLFFCGWNFKTGEPLAHDLDHLWQLSLTGETVWQRSLRELIGPNGADSACRFWVLPDGTTMIANVEVIEDEIDKIDGPSNFLVAIDLPTGKHERISPRGLHVGEPFLTYDASAVLFHGFVSDDLKYGKDDSFSMTMRAYRLKLADRKVESIFENATEITQARD